MPRKTNRFVQEDRLNAAVESIHHVGLTHERIDSLQGIAENSLRILWDHKEELTKFNERVEKLERRIEQLITIATQPFDDWQQSDEEHRKRLDKLEFSTTREVGGNKSVIQDFFARIRNLEEKIAQVPSDERTLKTSRDMFDALNKGLREDALGVAQSAGPDFLKYQQAQEPPKNLGNITFKQQVNQAHPNFTTVEAAIVALEQWDKAISRGTYIRGLGVSTAIRFLREHMEKRLAGIK